MGAGCASSQESASSKGFEQVIPAKYQPGLVKATQKDGYDLLRSKKSNSRVALSLRSATGDYLQFFVSVLNEGKRARKMGPQQVRLTYDGQTTPTGDLYADREVRGTEEGGAYAAESSEDDDALPLLRLSTLGQGRRATGFVYTPIVEGTARRFMLAVHVGGDVHKFRYALK
ncbi:MAG: hypothetical protein BRD48_06090 [Bacteroidetes bacterium QS_9_68_14]|nr:MAG: hypothetical protein BRD48_06090 [Bacteroidetes bacterium QS_9_68_14]